MKKILSTLLLVASLTSVQAQEVKIVSGKVRCSDHSEVVLPEGMSFRMKDLGNKRTLTPHQTPQGFDPGRDGHGDGEGGECQQARGCLYNQ